jgi:rsbT co-antagonist protein RsbR
MQTEAELEGVVHGILRKLQRVEQGDLSIRLEQEHPVNQPIGAIVAAINNMIDLISDARERTTDYRRELEQQITTIEKQRAAIRELSTPVIEVWAGVLCVPIIGVLDGERALEMTSALLSAVALKKTPLTIIDITGIENMDTSASDHFLRMARTVHLLGGECVLSGMNPNVAWTITQMQIDLAGIRTHRTLREALLHHVRNTRGAPQAGAGRDDARGVT